MQHDDENSDDDEPQPDEHRSLLAKSGAGSGSGDEEGQRRGGTAPADPEPKNRQNIPKAILLQLTATLLFAASHVRSTDPVPGHSHPAPAPH